ncbi:MAG: type I polyketide synthase, partial [bacterium]|nr:type I polyketide synthase [bacterium]
SFFSDKELEEAGIEPGLIKNPDYVKAKGVLKDKECFDAAFFGYTPLEAEIMNPQIRILHECVWDALEDAGYDLESYEGVVGLYAGASSSAYWETLVFFSGKAETIGEFTANLFSDKDFGNARVSYNLNLKGPVFSIHTACSSSLVGIHVACRALLMGECKMALAGGVSVAPVAKEGYLYQEGMVVSPDGCCRAFDAKAKGFVGGEGGGIVLLKRLKNALSDGDHIYAVIKGSAINNDGSRKVGFTAPSVDAQAEVIRTAQRLAGVEAETIGYIEAHGTATTLGDPVEIKALTLAFNTAKRNYCAIGSVKTNIGHLGIAAGLAGFIKTILALKHRFIPASLHFETPNPGIDFENSPFFVNAALKEWTNESYSLRAGVSSLGIGGTNAHVVLEEAPEFRRQTIEDRQRKRPQLIVLSAKTETALDKVTVNLVEYFKKHPEIDLADAAYTLQVGRRPFEHRKILVCSTVDEAVEALSTPGSRKLKTFLSTGDGTPVIFMFSGLGAQYVNMG